MYSFPKLDLPAGALAAAREAGKKPDVFYCLRLLEETGISTVPGSGFGQAPNTAHFRTTILPREEVMSEFVEKFRHFQEDFMASYEKKSSSGGTGNGTGKATAAAAATAASAHLPRDKAGKSPQANFFHRKSSGSDQAFTGWPLPRAPAHPSS